MFRIRIINIGVVLLFMSSFPAQTKTLRFYSEKILAPKKDSLSTAFGNNKIFYSKFELSSLTALSFYPELRDTKIIFKPKKLKSTMAARPKGLQILRRKGKRTYVILINDHAEAEIPADSIPFNARIGVIGHELSHIADYELKSTWSIIGIALRYHNKKFRRKFERATDKRAIEHGLRWQCYDFAVFVSQYKHASSAYKEYKMNTYMPSEEIQKTIP